MQDAKKIYRILCLLLVYGLVISGFILFGGALPTEIMVLDIVVSCIVITQMSYFLVFPLINLGREGHREVGMIGLHLSTASIYSLVAITLIVCGIAFEWDFKPQIFLQLGALLLLLLGHYLTMHAGSKVEQVHAKEQQRIEGRRSMQRSMEEVTDLMATTAGIEQSMKERLQTINDNLRYLTPSIGNETAEIESRFCKAAETIAIRLGHAKQNGIQGEELSQHIADAVQQLELYYNKRKNL